MKYFCKVYFPIVYVMIIISVCYYLTLHTHFVIYNQAAGVAARMILFMIFVVPFFISIIKKMIFVKEINPASTK